MKCTKDRDTILEWLEDFKANYGHFNESSNIISEIEQALEQYNQVVGGVKIPLDIQNACIARRKDESVLEYGLDYHISQFSSLLESGYPNSSQSMNESWIIKCTNLNNLLVEWLEDFKSKFQQYSESEEIISRCESLLEKYHKQVDKVKIPLEIQKARNARSKDGSSLEYGLDYHLQQMNNLVSISYQFKLVQFIYFFKSWIKDYLEIQDFLVEIINGLNKIFI